MPSKLSLHAQGMPELSGDTVNNLTMIVRASNMKYVKGIDVDYWPTPAHEMFPNQKVIGRFWMGGDAVDHSFVVRGTQGADDWFAANDSRIRKFIDEGGWAIEGPNEPHSYNLDAIATEALFWIQFMRNARALGLAPVWGSTGNGWFLFKGEDWPYIKHQILYYENVFKAQLDYGGYWGKHEYGAPNLLDGDGFWTLSYRKQLEVLGYAVPTIITECGITWAVLGMDDTGWQSHPGYVYPAQYGLPQGVMNLERYFRHLCAYDDELLKDDYIVSAHIFTSFPTNQWKTFDVSGGLMKLIVPRHSALSGVEYMQQFIIPRNLTAALEVEALRRNPGAIAVSREVDYQGRRRQVFRFPEDLIWQHHLSCPIGEWDDILYERRAEYP